MKVNRYAWIAALLCGALASCTGEREEQETSAPVAPDGAIAFSTDVETRGTVITKDNITEFGVLAYHTGEKTWDQATTDPTNSTVLSWIDNSLATKGLLDNWTLNPVAYWPVGTNEMISFFAYSPYGTNDNGIAAGSMGTVPALSYAINADISQQIDLTAAQNLNKTRDTESVALQFKHILVKLGIKALVDGTPDGDVVFTSVKLMGVRSAGLYTLAHEEWETMEMEDEEEQPMNIEVAKRVTILPGETPTPITPAGQYLFLIPQTTDRMSIEVEYTLKGVKQEKKSIAIGASEWHKGEAYNFTITYKATPQGSMSVTSAPAEWDTMGDIGTQMGVVVTYDANGGDNTPAPLGGEPEENVLVTTSRTTGPNTNWRFFCWTENADGNGAFYLPGAPFRMPITNSTLYASYDAVIGNVQVAKEESASLLNLTGATEYCTNYRERGHTDWYLPGKDILLDMNPNRTGLISVPQFKDFEAGTYWSSTTDGSGNTVVNVIANNTTPNTDGNLAHRVRCIRGGVLLTYDANGGTPASVPEPKKGVAGEQFNLLILPVPQIEGGRFVAWNTERDGSGTRYPAGATFTMPPAGCILFAQYEFLLNYDLNGGTGTKPEVSAAAAEASIVLTTHKPTHAGAGVRFAGWNTQSDGKGATYAAGGRFIMPAGGGTLYAVYVYSLTYDANKGKGAPLTEHSLPERFITLSAQVPTIGNGVFYHWNTTANGEGDPQTPGAPYQMKTESKTLYAQYIALVGEAQISLKEQAGATSWEEAKKQCAALRERGYQDWMLPGKEQLTQMQAQKTGLENLPNFTPFASANYWSGTTAGNDAYVVHFETAAKGQAGQGTNQRFRCIRGGSYRLTYHANGGMGAPEPKDATPNQRFQLATEKPIHQDGQFVAWNTRADGTGAAYTPGAPYLMPNNDLTLYAQYTFTLTFGANGGSNPPAAQQLRNGATVALPSAITTPSSQHRLAGWNTATNGTGTAYPVGGAYLMPAANTTLYAQFELITYPLSFNVRNGGSGAPATILAPAGKEVKIPNEKPTHGYGRFKGWNTDSRGDGIWYNPGQSIQIPEGGIVLYAHYMAVIGNLQIAHGLAWTIGGRGSRNYCANSVENGYDNWRVPTVNEWKYINENRAGLETIPELDLTFYSHYWTVTPNGSWHTFVYVYNENVFESFHRFLSATMARCVRTSYE